MIVLTLYLLGFNSRCIQNTKYRLKKKKKNHDKCLVENVRYYILGFSFFFRI